MDDEAFWDCCNKNWWYLCFATFLSLIGRHGFHAWVPVELRCGNIKHGETSQDWLFDGLGTD